MGIQVEGVFGSSQMIKAGWSIEAQGRHGVAGPIRIGGKVMHRSIKLTHGQNADAPLWPRQFSGTDEPIQSCQRLHHGGHAGGIVVGALLRGVS